MCVLRSKRLVSETPNRRLVASTPSGAAAARGWAAGGLTCVSGFFGCSSVFRWFFCFFFFSVFLWFFWFFGFNMYTKFVYMMFFGFFRFFNTCVYKVCTYRI